MVLQVRHVPEQIGYIALAGGGNQINAVSSFHVDTATVVEIGELGHSITTHDWAVVELAGSYSQPVIFMGVPSQAGSDEVVVRITNVTYGRGCPSPQTWCFSVRVQEPSCRNDEHVPENLNFLVLESGEFLADNQRPGVLGAKFQVGKSSIRGGGFREVEYHGDGFATSDASVLTHTQTTNEPAFVKTRQQPGDAYGFSVALEGELAVGNMADSRTAHGAEAVGWLAIESGSGQLGGLLYEARTTPSEVTHTAYTVAFQQQFRGVPRFFASIASRNGADPAAIRHSLCPDTSDVTCHVTRQSAIIEIEEEGKLFALLCFQTRCGSKQLLNLLCAIHSVLRHGDRTWKGKGVLARSRPAWHLAHQRIGRHLGADAVRDTDFGGERAATGDGGNKPDHIDERMDDRRAAQLVRERDTVFPLRFRCRSAKDWCLYSCCCRYEDPVVILGPPTSRAADPVVARVQNLQHGGPCVGWCFQASLQEACPTAGDGGHRGEALSYIVFEKGSYLTDEGAMFQVGSAEVAPNSDRAVFASVEFLQPFPPVGR